MNSDEFELEAIRAVASCEVEPDRQHRERARAELMTMITRELTTVDGARRERFRWRRTISAPARGIGALSGLAAAIAALVLILGHGGAAQPTSAAAALLERAANATAMVSPVHLGPGQVWYVEQVWTGQTTEYPRTCKADCYETRVVRWWVGPRRYSMHQYVISRSAKLERITKAPPNVPMTAAPYSPRWSGVGGGYDLLFHYKLMLTAPTGTNSLRALLLHPPGLRGVPAKMPRWEAEQLILENIQGILLEPRVPARMLSGLYRLLATMPGATLKGEVTDTLGRRAVEVEYRLPVGPRQHGQDLRYELLFDPKSYVLLDTIGITTSRKLPTSYSEEAYVTSGLVHRIGGLPGGKSGHWPW